MPKAHFLATMIAILMVGRCRADTVISVDSPAVLFSPANWAGDTGRAGSEYRTTWNNGAWCIWYWSTTAAHPAATLLISNPKGSSIAYFLDGKCHDNVELSKSGEIAIEGLSAGQHVLKVFTRASEQRDRWNRDLPGVNQFKITGLRLDDSAKPGVAPKPRPWVLIVGDSITEGISAAPDGGSSSVADYAAIVGQQLDKLGFDYGSSACGYSGWLHPGDSTSDVPAYYCVDNAKHDDARSRWNKIDSKTSLLDLRGHLSAYGQTGQEPSAILINYIVNEALTNMDRPQIQVSVTQCIGALRTAAPDAAILILVPPGLHNTRVYPQGAAYVQTLKNGVESYKSAHASDAKVICVDLGQEVSDKLATQPLGAGVHPNAAGHASIAPLVFDAMRQYLTIKP